MGFLSTYIRALENWQPFRAFGGGDYNEWRLVLMAPFGWPVRIFALVVAALILALAFRALRRDVRSRRAILLCLRALGLLSVLIILFQPAIKLRNVTRMPNHIAVVADVSQSMQLAEDGGTETRAARIAAVLRRARESGELRRIREDHILDFFGFGERLVPLSEGDVLRPAGPVSHAPATRIREALASVRQRYDGRDLAGIVLLSDGLDNGRLAASDAAPPTRTPSKSQDGQPAPVATVTAAESSPAAVELDADSISFLKTLDAPVHTIAVGKPGLRDVAISRVLSDQFAFVRTAVEVEAHVVVLGAQAAGWEGRHLPVTLRRDGQPVLTVEVAVLPGQSEYRVVFPFTPERVGKYLYEISVPTLPGEAIAENNHRAFVLRVVRDKIRVVHVAGRPTWDVRFLRGLLKHDPNIDLVSFFILRSPSDIEFVPSEETSLIPFPCEELFQEQLRSFDLVILHNFNYSAYCGQFLQPAIVPFVNEGGAVAMLGGDLSFSSGGYYGSELSQILPVVLMADDSGGLPVGATAGAGSSLIDSEPFQPRLTPAGKSHVVTALRLDVRENAALWDSLPPLEGLNLVARARPQATVLLSHPKLRDDSGNPMPVLTVAEFGKGRTLSLQADSTWRWGFGGVPRAELAPPRPGRRPASTNPAALGDDYGRGGAYQRFYTQAIRWLVRDPSLRLLRIETNDSEYNRGQPVRAELRAFGPDYRPAQRADINLSLTRITDVAGESASAGAPPAGSLVRSLRTDEEGLASVEWDSLPPGGYRVVARAVLGGRPAEDSEVFLIRSSSRELDDPEANERLLRLISEATGGEAKRYSDGGSSGPFKGLGFHPPHVVRVNQQRDVELWHTPAILFLAIASLALNWTLRRRWGYA
jgi:uncharacterized membrane protein